MGTPLPLRMKHVELVEIDKEEVVLKKALAALLAALHIVVVLEYVVVNKERIANTNRTVIT